MKRPSFYVQVKWPSLCIQMNDLGYVQVKRASLCVHVKKPCLCVQVNGFSFFVEGKNLDCMQVKWTPVIEVCKWVSQLLLSMDKLLIVK